jgi:hypothetical protein
MSRLLARFRFVFIYLSLTHIIRVPWFVLIVPLCTYINCLGTLEYLRISLIVPIFSRSRKNRHSYRTFKMKYLYGANLGTVPDVTVPYSTGNVPYPFTMTRGYLMVPYGTVRYNTGTVRYVECKEYVRTAPSSCVIVQHRLGQTRSTTYTKKVNATLVKSKKRTHIY